MNLLWLFILLTLTGLLFTWVEPLLVMPLVLPLTLFKNEKHPLFYVVVAVGLLWQLYVLLAWCIIVLVFTMLASGHPAVRHHWMYYLLGFIECLSPILYMASHDKKPDKNLSLSSLAVILVAVAFVAFPFVPHVTLPWAWLVRLLVHRYG